MNQQQAEAAAIREAARYADLPSVKFLGCADQMVFRARPEPSGNGHWYVQAHDKRDNTYHVWRR